MTPAEKTLRKKVSAVRGIDTFLMPSSVNGGVLPKPLGQPTNALVALDDEQGYPGGELLGRTEQRLEDVHLAASGFDGLDGVAELCVLLSQILGGAGGGRSWLGSRFDGSGGPPSVAPSTAACTTSPRSLWTFCPISRPRAEATSGDIDVRQFGFNQTPGLILVYRHRSDPNVAETFMKSRVWG